MPVEADATQTKVLDVTSLPSEQEKQLMLNVNKRGENRRELTDKEKIENTINQHDRKLPIEEILRGNSEKKF